jgi:pimeloyl-ACP methyl ester carboxylesterase
MSLAFERRGSGVPLVLLHGIGHHWRAWEPVIDLLADAHDVIAVDLPGFGRSPVPASRRYRGMPDPGSVSRWMAGLRRTQPPPGTTPVTTGYDTGIRPRPAPPEPTPEPRPAPAPTSIQTLVDEVAGFFAELDLERPHVAGNSLGGAIALELAAQGRVASATALSPAGFATAAQVRRALSVLGGHRLGSFTPAPVLRALYATGAGRALAFGKLVAEPARLTPERALADTLALRRGKGFRQVARRGRAYAFEARTSASAAVPVTVAWGTDDLILPYAQAARARALLPDARHVELTGCGHVPMSDAPTLVARVIADTVARASTA